MKTKKQKFGKRGQNRQRLFLALMAVVVAVIVYAVNMRQDNDVEGYSISANCQKLESCRQAMEEEEKATAAAMAATESMNYYQMKVASLNVEIANLNLRIASTEADIQDLKEQIAEVEAKLKLEQNALAELLIKMHFEGDSEPITILAGANSISDLAEKATRGEVAKQQISATALKIRSAKEKLEEDKAKVEELLESQKLAKQDLEATKAEQQELITKYQNDASAYNAQVEKARQAQKDAVDKFCKDNPDACGRAYDGNDTYWWRDECPGKFRNGLSYNTWLDDRPVGGQICECVSYVGWKAYEWYGIYLAWGNANTWDDNGIYYDYTVNHTPAEGAIGQMDFGEYGHVFWVERVYADGSIDITDHNWGVDGLFQARHMSAGAARAWTYIHLEQRHAEV